MKVSVTSLPLAEMDVDLLLVPVAEDVRHGVLQRLAGELDEAVTRAADDFDGELDESLLLYPDGTRARRVALLGLGPAGEVDAERLRRAAAVGAKLAQQAEVQTVGLAVPEPDTGVEISTEDAGQALVEGFVMGGYRFLRYKTEEKDAPSVERLVLRDDVNEGACRRGADRGRIIAEAVCSARDLVNLSPHDKTATMLAQIVERAGKKHGYDVSVWDKELIEEEGMGGLLAVNRGSTEPPTFTILEWKPEQPANERPVVLVGKGIVFDTGGLSLKSTKGSMDMMKADMGGAATVIGAFEAIARLKLPIHVVGLVPATDNRPGENAYVPGEVLRMHSGKTVEVLNTDAEGRLILADALSYARVYDPELAIDFATLTGAAVVALGSHAAALMTNETDGADVRLDDMIAAGRRSGDLVHPLPMFAEYGKLLESSVADVKNVGGREAGVITAGKFLEHFVDYPWLHVDIAGPAFLQEDKPYRPKGGTGFGVRLLVAFLQHYTNRRERRG